MHTIKDTNIQNKTVVYSTIYIRFPRRKRASDSMNTEFCFLWKFSNLWYTYILQAQYKYNLSNDYFLIIYYMYFGQFISDFNLARSISQRSQNLICEKIYTETTCNNDS